MATEREFEPNSNIELGKHERKSYKTRSEASALSRGSEVLQKTSFAKMRLSQAQRTSQMEQEKMEQQKKLEQQKMEQEEKLEQQKMELETVF